MTGKETAVDVVRCAEGVESYNLPSVVIMSHCRFDCMIIVTGNHFSPTLQHANAQVRGNMEYKANKVRTWKNMRVHICSGEKKEVWKCGQSIIDPNQVYIHVFVLIRHDFYSNC